MLDAGTKDTATKATNGHEQQPLAATSPITLARPLDDVERFLARFVAYPSEAARVAHVLWVVHAHLMDGWDSTPRIAFLSPEPGCGKSRALEVTELLVPYPVSTINVTAAYLFRRVGKTDSRPTLLFDECDTVFGPKARDSSEEIRALVNAGHRRHSRVGRCIVTGKTVRTEELPAYCAVAMAGIGDLPDTIVTRAVVVRMRRRAPTETIEPFRQRQHGAQAQPLRERLERWAEHLEDMAALARPTMPEGIVDRAADVWEPLLAVAEMAGGTWPERARAAAVALLEESRASPPSLGIRLLADLRQVFGDHDRLSSDAIVQRLCALDEAPWAELQGKGLNKRGLATRLRAYGVMSKTIRIDQTETRKGYERADLFDAWSRYLPALSLSPEENGTSVTSVTANAPAARNVSDVSDVTFSMGKRDDAGDRDDEELL
jgi:hypothetical protein